jgi:hypothetical protein
MPAADAGFDNQVIRNTPGQNPMRTNIPALGPMRLDIIDRNNVKVVFIWGEFSDYFRNNKESLSEFQKLAELVNLTPKHAGLAMCRTGFSTSMPPER